MTRRRFPVVATLVVLVAVGIMIRLGFWQLDRLAQKEAALAQFVAAQNDPKIVPLVDSDGKLFEGPYRKVTTNCLSVQSWEAVAGRSRSGESGISHVAHCRVWNVLHVDYLNFVDTRVVVGWSRDVRASGWRGGFVTGVLDGSGRLVADPPLAGLEANARPDPRDIPNKHLSYAVQWFLFAAVALVIYALAVRKRLLER